MKISYDTAICPHCANDLPEIIVAGEYLCPFCATKIIVSIGRSLTGKECDVYRTRAVKT